MATKSKTGKQKTCINVGKDVWTYLNVRREINETMEQVIARLLSITIEQAQVTITDGMEKETEEINKLI
jgi:hypothetical protein